jgi:hypothetical protein
MFAVVIDIEPITERFSRSGCRRRLSAENHSSNPFSMMMERPNVTGSGAVRVYFPVMAQENALDRLHGGAQPDASVG